MTYRATQRAAIADATYHGHRLSRFTHRATNPVTARGRIGFAHCLNCGGELTIRECPGLDLAKSGHVTQWGCVQFARYRAGLAAGTEVELS